MTGKNKRNSAAKRGNKNNNNQNQNQGAGSSAGRAPASATRTIVKTRTVQSVPRITRRGNIHKETIETIPSGSKREMEEWVTNHYDLKRCFLIPREQRAYVQPHKWDFSLDLLGLIDSDDTDRMAIRMRPSVKNFLSVGRPDKPVVPAPWDSGQCPEADFSAFQSSEIKNGITYDEDIHLVGMPDRLRAGIAEKNSQYKYLSGNDIKLGTKIYPGSPIDWDGKLNYELFNPDNAGAGMDVDLFMLREDQSGTIIEEVVNSFNVGANSEVIGTTGVANPALYTVAKGFGFGFRINNTETIGKVPTGLKFKMGFTNPPTIERAFVWRDFDVWSVINDTTGALKQQYESSNFHCFTALHATLTNQAAQLFKGGSINAAQLSGRSENVLPHAFSSLDRWIGSRTYDTNAEKSLAKGLHWNYRWEKVQDTFFVTEDQELNQGQDRPSLVTTLIAPPKENDSTAKQFAFTLHGAVMIEYITEVRDSPVFLAPADTINLLARYCAVRAEMPCLFENPSHWEGLKTNVKKILTHPVTKTLMKEAALAGLKLICI